MGHKDRPFIHRHGDLTGTDEDWHKNSELASTNADWRSTHQWQDDHGRWNDFDIKSDRQISEAFLKRQRHVDLVVGCHSYKVDLRYLQQTRNSTGKSRPIRACLFSFQWQDGREQWHAFDKHTDAEVSLSQVLGNRRVQILVATSRYLVDLTKLQQTNEGSGRIRPIRRLQRCYQYASRGSGWHSYDDRANSLIGWASLRHDHRATIWTDAGDAVLEISVNLSDMHQHNEATGCSRTIRQCWDADASVSTSSSTASSSTTGLEKFTRVLPSAAKSEKLPTVKPSTECFHSKGSDSIIVKVACDDDVRRGRVSWPAEASFAEKFSVLCATTRALFEKGPGAVTMGQQSLRYRDTEGDLCTLTETSMEDCLTFVSAGVLKLFANSTSAHLHGDGSTSLEHMYASLDQMDANDTVDGSETDATWLLAG